VFERRVPGSYGQRWKVYLEEADLQSMGQDSERLWESVVVRYADVDGTSRTVGPPGSGADVEDSRLQIIDPDHPAVRAGLTRRDLLDMQGLGTPSSAIEVGSRFLEEANLLDRSGQITLSGWVMDHRGHFWPASRVRSGDLVSIVNAHDTSYRKIVRKTYTHSNRSAVCDLDAPPEALDALLERLQVVRIPIGVG
jgi:hypothetical protein